MSFSVSVLAGFMQYDTAKVVLEEEILIEKVPPLDWPLGKAVVYFLHL